MKTKFSFLYDIFIMFAAVKILIHSEFGHFMDSLNSQNAKIKLKQFMKRKRSKLC